MSKNEEYSISIVSPNHCGTTVQRALENVGIATSESIFISNGIAGGGTYVKCRPYLPSNAFKAIMNNNPNGNYVIKTK